MLSVPAMASVINLVDQMMFRIEQTIGFPEYHHLFQHVFDPTRAVLPVIPTGLDQQRVRGNETAISPMSKYSHRCGT